MQPPLFILSPPRSFTTVTCAMLGNHPEMFGLAETNLFAGETVGDLARLYRFRARLQHGLLRSIAELGFGEQSPETVEAARAWLADNADMPTGELFAVLGEWAEGRTLVEKSPFHVYKIETMQRMRRHFPDAYFLHLTRHPTAVWKSVKETREQIAKTTEKMARFFEWGQGQMVNKGDLDPEKLWLRPHLTILEFLEEVPPERQLRIRGEDLLQEPRTYLAQICEWLGRRRDEAAIEAMLHPERSPFAGFGPPNARYGNDPKFMESPALRPYSYKPQPLDGVPMDGGAKGYSEALKHYAQFFGY